MRLMPLCFNVVFMLSAVIKTSYAYDDDIDNVKDLMKQDQSTWFLVRKDLRHNITTYSKREDNQSIRSFKAEAIYEASFDAVARHQLDANNYKNWFMNMEESKLLKKVSDTEFYYYFKLKAPLDIVPSRDAIINVKIQPYNDTRGSLLIISKAVPDYLAPNKGIVRMKTFETVIRITPLEKMKTKEETQGYADPTGNVPSWMINYLQRSMPYNNLLGRRRDIPNFENLTSPSDFKYKE